MKSNPVDILEELLIGLDDGLLIVLRMGDGLQKEKVKEICDVLIILRNQWQDKDIIPKKAAGLFAEFYGGMESSLELYSEEKQIEIMDAADQIMDLIRDCVWG